MSFAGKRVLVVDDEPQIVRTLRAGLHASGYEVLSASNGDDAVQLVLEKSPDVLILDLSMSPVDGFEVVERVRRSSTVPIIVLSVRDADRDKVRALDLGADDYLTKPFSLDELLARIRVALRHARGTEHDSQAQLQFGTLLIDVPAHVVSRDDQVIKLTPKEFALLAVLARHAGKVLTQRQLLQSVWGPEYGDEAAYLHVYIGQLRRKLETDPSHPRLIVTEPGVGYRFRSDD